MTNQRKIVEQFMNNESPERAPVVFWHHFVSFHDQKHEQGQQQNPNTQPAPSAFLVHRRLSFTLGFWMNPE